MFEILNVYYGFDLRELLRKFLSNKLVISGSSFLWAYLKANNKEVKWYPSGLDIYVLSSIKKDKFFIDKNCIS